MAKRVTEKTGKTQKAKPNVAILHYSSPPVIGGVEFIIHAHAHEFAKAGDFAGMEAQITDEHIAAFATESTWDGLADALDRKYGDIATRIVLYNALTNPERVERYGEVARRLQC